MKKVSKEYYEIITEEITVSEGTLNTVSLIEKFENFLVNETDFEPDNSLEMSEDEQEFYLETLMEEMNNLSGDGLSFESHIGDGACFGFWRYEDEC